MIFKDVDGDTTELNETYDGISLKVSHATTRNGLSVIDYGYNALDRETSIALRDALLEMFPLPVQEHGVQELVAGEAIDFTPTPSVVINIASLTINA